MVDTSPAAGPQASRPAVSVITLSAEEQPRAVDVLTLAFLGDTIYRTLIPDDKQRRRSLAALWAGLIPTCRRYGLAHTTPDVAGVACWLAPGHSDLGFWQILRTGLALPRAVMRFPAEARKRFLDMVAGCDRIRQAKMPHHHWYLWALGVDPQRQRQGIGGALVDRVGRVADEQRLPCYLETESEANVRFYSSHGFEVVFAGDVSGLPMWAMLRPPQRPGEGRQPA